MRDITLRQGISGSNDVVLVKDRAIVFDTYLLPPLPNSSDILMVPARFKWGVGEAVVEGGVSITIAGTTPVATFAQPSSQIAIGQQVPVGTQLLTLAVPSYNTIQSAVYNAVTNDLTFSAPAYSSRTGARIDANTQDATFSILSSLLATGASITANTLEAILSQPASAVRLNTALLAVTQEMVLTTIAYSPKINSNVPVATLEALFSLDAILPKAGTVVIIDTGVMTFTTQISTAGGITRVLPITVELTLGTLPLDCLTSVVFTPNTISLTFSTGILEKAGSTWTFYPRNSVGDWSRRRVQFHDLYDNYE